MPPAGKNSNIVKAVGARIRELRKARRMAQKTLAAKAGISVSFLSMIERGERAPHIETIGHLADALGVAVPALFDDGRRLRLPHPSYERLIEFAARHQLAQEDIDRLLRIGEAALRPS